MLAVRGFCRLLSPLPIGALRRLGSLLGTLALLLGGRGVRTTRVNADVAYADRDVAWRRRLVRRSIRQTAMIVAETVALWTWPHARLERLLVAVEGEHLLRRRGAGGSGRSGRSGQESEENAGRGVLVLIPHFGNWEYLGYYLGRIGTVVALYEPPASAVLDALLRQARERIGLAPVPDSTAGVRHVLRALKGGAPVVLLPDQVPVAGAGVAAPFHGRQAYTMTLAAKLLQRVEADAVIATAERVRGGFKVVIEAVDDAIRDADAARSAAAMNAAIEAVVARDPAQYQWEYKRYRFPRQPNIYR